MEKIFKWLGDLAEDFKGENMKPSPPKIPSSNLESDHDIYSKFRKPFQLFPPLEQNNCLVQKTT